MMIGLYAAIAKHNLIKKVIGLSLFQTGIFIFYISLGVVEQGVAPISVDAPTRFANAFDHLAARDGADPEALARAREAVEEVLHPHADHADHGDSHLDVEAPETVAHALEAAGRELPADQAAALTELTRRDRLIVDGVVRPYTNPLPHVLILTAIVVSVSTLAVALAIIVWIRREFGTIEDDELTELELEVNNDAKGGEA
ncbi:MAG: cation:proton antiporter subunit C [Planctomycetes bacterium]|nr:cation:proton antiporter subunit C [Planctomycetota bacterium]